MSKSKRRRKHKVPTLPATAPLCPTLDKPKPPDSPSLYERACRLVESGEQEQAREVYRELLKAATEPKRKALLVSDMAALAAVGGDMETARKGFQDALAVDPKCEPARANLALLDSNQPANGKAPKGQALPVTPAEECTATSPVKVAILSFLFNWPSTGGGIIHTVELAQFLAKAGYEVRHFYVRHEPWGVGKVEGTLPFASEALAFDEASWTVPQIQARFRQAVDRFMPDHVIITDSWNMKPLLAEAVQGYPYILRFQAMECLCPLNNVRLLPEPGGRLRQCLLNQFANPSDCSRCLQQHGQFSGSLHQAERALCGVGTREYHERLLRAFRQAEAVFVVNSLTADIVAPYVRNVRVVTSAMDPARFPWPWPDDPGAQKDGAIKTIFFAGIVEELMKGFNVLQAACTLLWQRRQDFEVVATGDPPGKLNDFTRFVGWLSQEELPRHLRSADMLVMPTVAQEALGRTAVEAMGVGRPVIASRLGGLPYTVIDGVTGLLCEPGSPEDLAAKIEVLLDDTKLCARMGLAGRKRFEEHYAWPVIIERHYRPLLQRVKP